jgi:hypothetical protein
MRDPAIRILFLVLIAENHLKGSPLQVHVQDIGRGERHLGQSCEEEFIHDAVSCHPNWGRFLGCRMGGNDDSHRERCPGKRDLWTIEERTAGSCFRMGGHFVWW